MTNATRKIGRNRGKPRLWIEGKLLIECGFKHGDRWTLYQTFNGLLLVKEVSGKRKIAGTPDRPIIDISGGVLDRFTDTNKVKLYCPNPGRIMVLPC